MKKLLNLSLLSFLALFLLNTNPVKAAPTPDAEMAQCLVIAIDGMVVYDDFVRVFFAISLHNTKGTKDIEIEHGYKIRHILPLTMSVGQTIVGSLLLPRAENTYTTSLDGTVLNGGNCSGYSVSITVPGTSTTSGPFCLGC